MIAKKRRSIPFQKKYQRSINGKRFIGSDVITNKQYARKVAEAIRTKTDRNARVIPNSKGFRIYVGARRYNHTEKEKLRVLVGCESSGTVRDAFLAAGHDAWSCDITPPDSPSPRHIQDDVMKVIGNSDWDIAILHPPCTYLSSSGLHWNKRPGYEDRAAKTEAALEFVDNLLNADVDEICLENPVGCISTKIRKPDQYIQPHQFGDDASKKTGLWLKNLPLLEHTVQIEPRLVGGLPRWANQADSGQGLLWPSANRSKIRSKTYKGIAAAMAKQWGVPEGYIDYGIPQPYGFGNYGPAIERHNIIEGFTGQGGTPKAAQSRLALRKALVDGIEGDV